MYGGSCTLAALAHVGGQRIVVRLALDPLHKAARAQRYGLCARCYHAGRAPASESPASLGRAASVGGVGEQHCAHTCRPVLLLASWFCVLLSRVPSPAWRATHRTPCCQRITRASGALLTLHVGTQHSNVVALRTSVSMRHELKDKDTRAFRLGGWWEARGRRPRILFRRQQRRRFWRRFLRPSPMPPPAALAALLAHAASSVLAAAVLAALHPHAAASALAWRLRLVHGGRKVPPHPLRATGW